MITVPGKVTSKAKAQDAILSFPRQDEVFITDVLLGNGLSSP
jgi:hypothetical protein